METNHTLLTESAAGSIQRKNFTDVPDLSVRWRNGSLTQDSIERLRRLVERQKLKTCKVESAATDGSLRPTSQELPASSDPSVGLLDFNNFFDFSHPLLRKVREGLPPPNYPGFSSVDSRSAISTRKSSNIRSVYPGHRVRSGRSPTKVPLRRLTAHADRTPFEGKSKLPKGSYNPDSWRHGRCLIRKHLDGEDNLDSGLLRKHISYLSVEQDSYDPQVNRPTSVNRSDTNLSKNTQPDGFPRFKKYATPTNNAIGVRKIPKIVESGPDHKMAGARPRVSRADLQALVRKQRETRKAEREKNRLAEAERRERIQQNLSATALAASLAAKLPSRPNMEPKRTHHSSDEVCKNSLLRDENSVLQWFPPATYSEERVQRLNALLEEELKSEKPVDVPQHPKGRSRTAPPSKTMSQTNTEKMSQSSESKSKGATSSASLPLPDVTPPSTTTSLKEPSVSSKFSFDIHGDLENSVGFKDPGSLYCENVHLPRPFELLATTAADNGQLPAHDHCLSTRLFSFDFNDRLGHETASVSSCDDSSPPTGHQWLRLEAVGASDSEQTFTDKTNGEIVDDLLPVEQEIRRPKFRLQLDFTKNISSDQNHLQSKPITVPCQNNLRHDIYNDPLRFVTICKRQKVEFFRSSERASSKPRSPLDVVRSLSSKVVRRHPSTKLFGEVNKGNQGGGIAYSDSARLTVSSSTSIRSSVTTRTQPNDGLPNASSSSHGSSGPSSQQDFLLHAAQQAVSSTPCRDIVQSALSVKQPSLILPAKQKPTIPRLTASALSLKLSAEMNQLDALDTSLHHLAEVEALRRFAMAQAESVSLAQLLKSAEHQVHMHPTPHDQLSDRPVKLAQQSASVSTASFAQVAQPVKQSVTENGASEHVPVPVCSSSSSFDGECTANHSTGSPTSEIIRSRPSSYNQENTSMYVDEQCESAVNSQSLSRVKSELNNRAAVLKMRKERAQNLIALTKNLEKEEENVAHLERVALKAIQGTRKRKRLTRSSIAQKAVEEVDVNMTESYLSDFHDRTNVASDLDILHATRSSHSLTSHPIPDKPISVNHSVSTVQEASSLKESNADVSNVLSIAPSSKAFQRSSHRIQSPSCESHISSDSRLEPDQSKRPSSFFRDSKSNSVSGSRAQSTTLRFPSGSSVVHQPFSARFQSSERCTPPCSGFRRSRPSSRDSSCGPTATSVDDEVVTASSDTMPDEDQISQTYSQLVDVSAMESRVRALHGELKRQEQMLSRINKLSKHYSADRLARLQTTLIQHKQLCTEIIQNIKNQLSVCQTSVLSDSAHSTFKFSRQTSVQMNSTILSTDTLHGTSVQQAIQSKDHSNDGTLALVAEDLVSATDTEGDLQKLEFDEKTATPPPSSIHFVTDEEIAPSSSHEKTKSETTAESEAKTLTVSLDSEQKVVNGSVRQPFTITSGHQLTSDNLTDVAFETDIPSATAVPELTHSEGPLHVATVFLRDAVPSTCCEALSDAHVTLAQTSVIESNSTKSVVDVHRSLPSIVASLSVIQRDDSASRPLDHPPTEHVHSFGDAVSAQAAHHPPAVDLTKSEPQTVLATPVRSPSQLLVDEITNSLFVKLLSDAVDAVTALNKRKDENLSPSDFSVPKVLRPAVKEQVADNREIAEKLESLYQYLSGCVADIPSRIDALILEAVQFLWDARSKAPEGSREAAIHSAARAPPEIFQSHWVDPRDLDPELHAQPDVRFVSRMLLFDLVAEAVGQIYAEEDREFERALKEMNYHPRVTSFQFHLWNGPTRPQTLDRLVGLVRKQVQQTLQLRTYWLAVQPANPLGSSVRTPYMFPGANKLSRTTQWTLSRKSFLDGILELELRDEEGSWLSYTAEETQVKSTLFNQIWQEILHDALETMIRCSRPDVADSVEL